MNDLAAKLDAKYGVHQWILVRQIRTDKWCVSVRGQSMFQPVKDCDTIEEALQAAIDYVEIPRLRPPPLVLVAENFEVVKRDDGKWEIMEGDCRAGTVPTRKYGLECIESRVARSIEARDEWQRQFDEMFPNGAQEGVDYEFHG